MAGRAGASKSKQAEAGKAVKPVRPGKAGKGGRGHVVAVVVAVLLVAIVGACAAVVVLRPAFAESTLEALGIPPIGVPAQGGANNQGGASNGGASQAFSEIGDPGMNSQELAHAEEQRRLSQPTPLIARCDGVDLRSSIRPADITGILFHQASYEYALELETEVPEADYETVADQREMRVNRDQQTGEWLDAEILHLWRTTDDTAMETSIDLGALPGTTVLSPVDGTIVLVRDYMLYDEMPDIEIHIQPDGRPDLDCVLIHTTDPAVKAGDHVKAGVTPISKVRDIEEYLTDVQLSFFVPEDVGGNHVHIQMNDATFPDYREKKLEGASE